MTKNTLTQSSLKEYLNYNPDTGIFTRLKQTSHLAKVGFVAGNKNTRGYIDIALLGNRYLGHRLAWFYMTGNWPKDKIDHIDGNPSNNKISNLRECTQAENLKNIHVHKDNKSGFKGVNLHKFSGLWHAKARLNGKNLCLGYFKNPELAGDAYKKFARENHGEFFNAE